jgi:proteic killer suppression protein
MIKSFADKETEELYITGKSRKIPRAVCHIGVRKLDYLNASTRLNDLKSPPGNRLEQLKGDRKGYYGIRVNERDICITSKDSRLTPGLSSRKNSSPRLG